MATSKTALNSVIIAACLVLTLLFSDSWCDESWRAGFDEACAKTTDAMALSSDELKSLIEKCDRLQKIIENQDETVRKVYLKRLQMCKNLYLYVLEAKSVEQLRK